jgi:hybrid cluster-associated redox disulfide protein
LRWRKDGKALYRHARGVTATQVSEQLVADVIAMHPAAAAVFVNYRMGCVGCAFARFETVREAAIAHGIDPDAVAKSLATAVGGIKRKKT